MLAMERSYAAVDDQVWDDVYVVWQSVNLWHLCTRACVLHDCVAIITLTLMGLSALYECNHLGESHVSHVTSGTTANR